MCCHNVLSPTQTLAQSVVETLLNMERGWSTKTRSHSLNKSPEGNPNWARSWKNAKYSLFLIPAFPQPLHKTVLNELIIGFQNDARTDRVLWTESQSLCKSNRYLQYDSSPKNEPEVSQKFVFWEAIWALMNKTHVLTLKHSLIRWSEFQTAFGMMMMTD